MSNPKKLQINPKKLQINPHKLQINHQKLQINPKKLQINPKKLQINPQRYKSHEPPTKISMKSLLPGRPRGRASGRGAQWRQWPGGRGEVGPDLLGGTYH